MRSLSCPLVFAFAALMAPAGHADEGRGTGAQGARWPGTTVDMVVDSSVHEASRDAYESIVDALGAWQVDGIELPVVTVGQGEVKGLGYSRTGHNTNSIIFAPDGAERANGALAITVITFDLSRGVILDADILLNGEYKFARFDADDELEGRAGAYDLQNVVTHELGHFFGLGEDYKNEGATMYAYSLPGETSKRDLEESDAVTVATLYARPATELGAAGDDSVGCGGATIANRAGAQGGWAWMGLCLVLAVCLARRRAFQLAVVFTCASAGLGLTSWDAGTEAYQVAALTSRWDGDLIVTRAELRLRECSDCRRASVEVLGGVVDGVGQQVGALRPLKVGDRVNVSRGQLRLSGQ